MLTALAVTAMVAVVAVNVWIIIEVRKATK